MIIFHLKSKRVILLVNISVKIVEKRLTKTKQIIDQLPAMRGQYLITRA